MPETRQKLQLKRRGRFALSPRALLSAVDYLPPRETTAPLSFICSSVRPLFLDRVPHRGHLLRNYYYRDTIFQILRSFVLHFTFTRFFFFLRLHPRKNSGPRHRCLRGKDPTARGLREKKVIGEVRICVWLFSPGTRRDLFLFPAKPRLELTFRDVSESGKKIAEFTRRRFLRKRYEKRPVLFEHKYATLPSFLPLMDFSETRRFL